MACEEFENRLLDYQENHLSAGERTAVERHLANCAKCQALVRQLQHLDAALLRTVKVPTLRADFSARLQQRIQAGTVVLSKAQIAERKRRMQAEYEAGLAQICRWPLRFASLLGYLRLAVLSALAVGLAWQFMPRLVTLFVGPVLDELGGNPLLAAAAGLVFLALCVAAAFPRQLRRLWPAF
jgi:anti-sigma factor RsiW